MLTFNFVKEGLTLAQCLNKQHRQQELGHQIILLAGTVSTPIFPWFSCLISRAASESLPSLKRHPSVVWSTFCVHLITNTEPAPASSLCRESSRSGLPKRKKKASPLESSEGPRPRFSLSVQQDLGLGVCSPSLAFPSFQPLKSHRQHDKYGLSVKNLFI